ncbi:hypothetical protein [Gallaecimonas mangrovi]|uniref:hypothetical protein n=1 Tax=Gallaecimonas mangrovi TaxID=2291597 RepID=UPI000E1FB828|nr:hypothetical protein [Gallaecimonas mangrovi]
MARRISGHWLSKSLAGVVLGFLLALGLGSLFAIAGPGGLEAANKVQFVMWLVAPLWMLALSLVFLFKSGLRAWLWLGLANALVYGLLWGLKNGL